MSVYYFKIKRFSIRLQNIDTYYHYNNTVVRKDINTWRFANFLKYRKHLYNKLKYKPIALTIKGV